MIKGRILAKILPFQLELLLQGKPTAPRDEGELCFRQEMKALGKHHFTKPDEHMHSGRNSHLVLMAFGPRPIRQSNTSPIHGGSGCWGSVVTPLMVSHWEVHEVHKITSGIWWPKTMNWNHQAFTCRKHRGCSTELSTAPRKQPHTCGRWALLQATGPLLQ